MREQDIIRRMKMLDTNYLINDKDEIMISHEEDFSFVKDYDFSKFDKVPNVIKEEEFFNSEF